MRRLLSQVSESRELWLIFSVGLAFRLLFLVYFGPISTPDTPGYVGIANDVASGHFYERSDDILRLPGYPLFAAAVFRLSEHSDVAVVFVQQLLSAITIVIVYQMAREIFDPSTGIISGWLVALNPSLAYYGTVILSETLSIFLGALATWLVVCAIRRKPTLFFSAGLVLAYLVWTKPILLLFYPAFVLVVFLNGRWRETWKYVILLTLPVLGIYLGWTVHNAVRFGSAVYAPSNGLNLLERTVYFNVAADESPIRRRALANFSNLKAVNALGAEADEIYYSLAVINTWSEYRTRFSVPDLNQQFFEVAWQQIRGNPISYGATTVREIAYFWAGYTPNWAKHRPTKIAEIPDWSFLVLRPCLGALMFMLTVYGCLQIEYRRNWLSLICILPIPLITIATAMIIPTDYQYRLVVEPQILSLIAYAIAMLVHRERQSYKPKPIPSDHLHR